MSTTSALAQGQPPAGVGAPTREELQRVPLPSQATRGPRLSIDSDIDRAPCPLAAAQFQDITFTLSEVRFSGLRGAAADDLSGAYADLVGQTIPIAAVCDIRDAASATLRRMGYLASIQVPPQRIEDGVLQLDVLMAKVTAIQVRGPAGRAERLIAAYLEPLTRDEVFNQFDAERRLLLARDLPGVDVRMTLKSAGAGPGEVIGEVTVIARRGDVSFAVQNHGSSEVGRDGLLLHGQVYGLTGLGDRTALALFGAGELDEQRLVQLSHDFRVGGNGLTLGGSVTYARTEPDLGAAPGRISSDTVVVDAFADYPLVRTQALTVRLQGGLQTVSQDVRFNGLGLTKDRLSVAFVDLQLEAVAPDSVLGRGGYTPSEPRWRIAGSLEARQGLSAFGARESCGPPPGYLLCGPGSTPPSRIDADPQGALFRLNGSVEYRPTPALAISAAPRAQYAPNPLASFEEFSAGAYTIGRGYDPGAISGDSGAGAALEISHGTLNPGSRTGRAVQPFGFYDVAWVWNGDLVRDEDRVDSAGAGVRIAFLSGVRLQLAVAKPLRRAPLQTANGGARALISLTAPLWPRRPR